MPVVGATASSWAAGAEVGRRAGQAHRGWREPGRLPYPRPAAAREAGVAGGEAVDTHGLPHLP